VAAALNCGVICGEAAADGNRGFRAGDGITRAEAASIIDRALELTDDGRIPTFRDTAALPQWATQSVINTTAAGIVSVFSDNTVRADSTVTRGDAVDMLYQMLQFRQNNADDGGSFLGIFG